MRYPLFSGVCTAMVTPFLNGQVNYPMMEQLLHRQMNAGINAVVICGTTGEAPTLKDCEKIELFKQSTAVCHKHCTVIAGTGSNDTGHCTEISQEAECCGADALLIVSPYYNKATPDGLIQHYGRIAEKVNIPIIVYNVPSRTGMDIPVSVYRELSQISGIVGVKEASADITKILKIKAECPPDFCVWSGNDNQCVPAMSIGADGVISVLSNLWPEEMLAMTFAALDGDFDTAAALQTALYPMMSALFAEVSPIPIKAAMRLIGYDCGDCRLPLSAAGTATLANLKAIMQETGLPA